MAQAHTGPGHARVQSRSLDDFAADQPARCLDDRVPAEVNHELATFLRAKRKGAARIDSHFVAAVDSLSQFVLGGGKRLRPIFAWWGWRGAGGSPVDPQACAVLRAVSSL